MKSTHLEKAIKIIDSELSADEYKILRGLYARQKAVIILEKAEIPTTRRWLKKKEIRKEIQKEIKFCKLYYTNGLQGLLWKYQGKIKELQITCGKSLLIKNAEIITLIEVIDDIKHIVKQL